MNTTHNPAEEYSYTESQNAVLQAVRGELNRARAKFPRPMHSAHEAIAVIREEYLEVEREVFWKTLNRAALRAELIQLAAMAMRAIEDLNLVEEKGQAA